MLLWSNLFKDIRFWIVFFFLIRLVGITNPPLELGHNWRQTTVTMVARNFFEGEANILYPQVDFAGELSGITGMEFPLLNYLIYVFAEVFGYQHWYGRLINLLFSSIGLWYFFLLIRNFYSKRIAFSATLLLTVSIWLSFSRKIMPDTFSASLIIAAIYYGSNYLDRGKNAVQLILYAVLLCLGALAKLPAAYLLVVFTFFIFKKGISVRRKILFITASTLALIPVLGWYFY